MNPRLWLCLWVLAAAAPAGAAPAKKPAVPPAGVVTGRVLLPTGKPAAGAQVWIGWMIRGREGFTEGKASAAGTFRLASAQKVAEAFWVGAAAPGAAPNWTAITTKAGPLKAPKPVTLKLPAPIAVTGFLVDSSGRPKAGVTVKVPRLCSDESGPFGGTGAAMTPPSVLAALKARSAANGAFKISGLPPRRLAYLALPSPMVSPEIGFRLGRGPVQPVGIIPAIRTGSLQITAQSGGEPAAGGTAWLRRVVTTPSEEVAVAFGRRAREARAGIRKIELEANGLGLVEGLQPGRYEVAFHGRIVPVEVPEGDAAPPVMLSARALSGSGFVRDAAGKPVPGARVSVQIGNPPVDWPPGPQNAVVTDERGAWSVEEFPWEAPVIVVRAQTADASAEWRGSPAALRGPLSLTLKVGTLLTVRGRLMWNGKPAPGAPVAVFTREDGRPQGIAVGKTDPDGRFELGGVRRGLRYAIGTVLSDRPFESAFHTSPETGDEQDLGDVTVRPQLASLAPGTPEWAGLFWPAPIPADAEIERAREAGFRFLEALRKGDAPAAHGLLSPVSQYYEPDLTPFLAEGAVGLQIPVPEAASLTRSGLFPIRISPRGLLATRLSEESDLEDRRRLIDALERPDWLALAYASPQGVHGLFLMHREADGWRVVDGIDSGAGASFVPGAEKLLTTPAPSAPAEAVAAAEGFLKAAAAGDLKRMRSLLAKDAREWSASDGAFEKAWSARPEAMKPAVSGAAAGAMTGLSAWDVLTLYVNGVLLGDYRPGRFEKDPTPAARRAADRVRTGRLTAVRFTAGDREYVMLLSREESGWRVVEPALPLGPKP